MTARITFGEDTATTWKVECSACGKKRGRIYVLVLGGLGLDLCRGCAIDLRTAVAA